MGQVGQWVGSGSAAQKQISYLGRVCAGGTRGRHTPPAPFGVDLVGDQPRTPDVEQFDESVVPSGDGRIGLEGRPEGVHDYRVASGVGVDTGKSLVYGAEKKRDNTANLKRIGPPQGSHDWRCE